MPRKKKTEAEAPKKETKKKEIIRVGDIISLKNDHRCLTMEFKAGTEVLVVEETSRGFSINNNPSDPKNGFTMIECGYDL